jgi:hypothetical protein
LNIPKANPRPAPPRAQRSGNDWLLASHDGQQYGPTSWQQLEQWVTEGLVTPQCHIRQSSDTDWQAATRYFPRLNQPLPAAQRPAANNGMQIETSNGGFPQLNVGGGGSTSSTSRRKSRSSDQHLAALGSVFFTVIVVLGALVKIFLAFAG